MKKDCIFCKVINGNLPAKFVYKDNDIVAFKDIKPVAPVHIIIVPKKHIDNLLKTKDSDTMVLGKILRTAAKVAKKMGIEDFRVINANGSGAGQTVFHMHYHLVGGWKDSSPKMESEPGGLRQ